MDRKKYVFEASDDVKKVMAMGVTHGGAIWTDTMDIENLEELNSDYINEHFEDLQDTAYKKGLRDGESKCRYCNEYQRGLDDAWDAARKLVFSKDNGGLGVYNLLKIFGSESVNYALKKYSAPEAIAKIKAYEEKQKADDEIKVGDEVRILGTDNKFFIVGYEDDCICGFASGGKTCRVQPVFAQKTGKHINLDSILEEMK